MGVVLKAAAVYLVVFIALLCLVPWARTVHRRTRQRWKRRRHNIHSRPNVRNG